MRLPHGNATLDLLDFPAQAGDFLYLCLGLCLQAGDFLGLCLDLCLQGVDFRVHTTHACAEIAVACPIVRLACPVLRFKPRNGSHSRPQCRLHARAQRTRRLSPPFAARHALTVEFNGSIFEFIPTAIGRKGGVRDFWSATFVFGSMPSFVIGLMPSFKMFGSVLGVVFGSMQSLVIGLTQS